MDGSGRLARVFVELADTLLDEFDPVDFLQLLADRCVELLDADAAGLVLADERGRLQVVAAAPERAHLLELLGLAVREGPCRDTFTSDEPLTGVDLAAAPQRWPRFAGAALDAGFRTVHVLPMRLRHEVIGALVLVTEEVRPLSDDGLAVGRAMADVATIGLLRERTLRDQQVVAEQLRSALTSRVLIEQAKGALAERLGIGVDEAFTRLRAHARRHGATLTSVATAVVEGTVHQDLLLTS
jgi:GAF domain-containing protein